MSVVLVDNKGRGRRFNDINCVTSSQRHYLVDGQSDIFKCNEIWSDVSTFPTSPTQQFVVNGTDSEREAMNEQYYWLFGDAFHGGIAFRNDSTSMTRYMYDTATETIATVQGIPKTGWFYLYLNELLDGNINIAEPYQYEIQSWQTGGCLKGQYANVYPTTPPSWVLEFAENPFSSLPEGFGVQTTWDYFLPDIPTGSTRNSTGIDGLNLEIAGVTVGFVISPFIYGGSRTAKIEWYSGVEKRTNDPDEEAPESSTGGGNGIPQESVDIDFPNLPPEMLTNSGLINMFNPSSQDLKDLVDYLYTQPDAFYTNVKKLWANPMESIISLSIIPFTVEQLGSKELKFCGVATGLNFPTVNQYCIVDCGYIDLPEEYASFLDYGAFTKIKLWLPFIGIVDLNPDDTIGGRITIQYNCDLFTGECLAFVKSTKTNEGQEIRFDSVIYCFKGNIIESAPITGNSYQALYSGVLGLVDHVALATVDPIGGAKGMASDIISPKVNVQRSGTATGNSGMLGEYKPYVIIERPVRNRPANNGKYNGYPLNMTIALNGSFYEGKEEKFMVGSGFTIVRDGTVRIYNTDITNTELSMIKDLLESGVII